VQSPETQKHADRDIRMNTRHHAIVRTKPTTHNKLDVSFVNKTSRPLFADDNEKEVFIKSWCDCFIHHTARTTGRSTNIPNAGNIFASLSTFVRFSMSARFCASFGHSAKSMALGNLELCLDRVILFYYLFSGFTVI